MGCAPGAAWRAALRAASEVGAQQVLLADLPTSITGRKLADALYATAGARAAGALGLLLSSVVGALATSVLDPAVEAGVVAAAFAGAVALLWPVVGPFLEISAFSGACMRGWGRGGLAG